MICVIYARYSSENQSEESITAQIRACTEYAVRNGHTVVKHYIDRAMSARSDQRPQFQQMINDAKQHEFQGIIVHKLDRFSRDRYDHAFYRKELKKANVKLYSVLENLDDSPESVVLESVLEGFSEYYSKNLARETRKGLKEIALQAKYTGGTVLYGYSVDEDGHFIINEAEATVIRKIYDACYNKTGYNRLLDELRIEGVRTRYGNYFTASSFYYILKNPQYCGDYVYSTVGERKHAKGKVIVQENAVPAIIPKAKWQAVQVLMAQRRKKGGNHRNAKEVFLLSGILYCGKCGAPMHGHRQKRRADYVYYSYECSTKNKTKQCDQHCVQRDRIENAVCDYVRQLLSPKGIAGMKKYLCEHMELINGSCAAEIAAYEKELSSIEKKIDRTLDLLIDLPSNSLKKKLNDFENRKLFLESQIYELKHSVITPDVIEKELKVCCNFDDLTREEKQQIIRKIIKKVTISKDGDSSCTVISLFTDTAQLRWRCHPESNWGSRSCSPLPYRLAMAPYGADDEARTRYLHLGKVALYQMSYIRILWCLRAESNHRHGDFQSPALPTELQRQVSVQTA